METYDNAVVQTKIKSFFLAFICRLQPDAARTYAAVPIHLSSTSAKVW